MEKPACTACFCEMLRKLIAGRELRTFVESEATRRLLARHLGGESTKVRSWQPFAAAFGKTQEELLALIEKHQSTSCTHMASTGEPVAIARMSSSPKKLCLPPRDAFVGREGLVRDVLRRLEAAQAVALSGVTGCGKTHLAIEVAHRWRGDVAWVDLHGDRLDAMARTARAASLVGSGASAIEAGNALLEWLTHSPGRLLVLDGADSTSLLSHDLGLASRLANLSCARIVIASAAGEDRLVSRVEVPSALDENDAMKLILRGYIGDPAPLQRAARRICSALGRFPQAVAITCDYLSNHVLPRSDRVELLTRVAERLEEDPAGTLASTIESAGDAERRVTSALQLHLKALSAGARELVRVAGATVLTQRRLALLGGVSFDADLPPSSFDRAWEEVRALFEIVEDRPGDALVRMYPLINAVVGQGRDGSDEAKRATAERVIAHYEDLDTLSKACAKLGAATVNEDLDAAAALLSPRAFSDDNRALADRYYGLVWFLQQESATLDGWDGSTHPAFLVQQLRNRLVGIASEERPESARRRLTKNADKWLLEQREPYFQLTTRHVQASPEREQILTGHQRDVNAVVGLPRGRIASASSDGSVRVWNGSSSTLIGQHDSPAWALAIDSARDRVLSGSDDKTVRAWRVSGCVGVRPSGEVLSPHDAWVNAVAASSNGRFALSGDDTGKLAVWDLAQRKVMCSERSKHQGWILAIAIHQSDAVAVGSQDGTVSLWRLGGEGLLTPGDRVPIGDLSVRGSWVRGLAFGPTGDVLYVASMNHGVWKLEIEHVNGVPKARSAASKVFEHARSVRGIAVHADGRFVSGSDDESIGVFSPDGKLIARLVGHRDRVRAVAFSHDGQSVLSGSSDGTVARWRFPSDSSELDPRVRFLWPRGSGVLLTRRADMKIEAVGNVPHAAKAELSDAFHERVGERNERPLAIDFVRNILVTLSAKCAVRSGATAAKKLHEGGVPRCGGLSQQGYVVGYENGSVAWWRARESQRLKMVGESSVPCGAVAITGSSPIRIAYAAGPVVTVVEIDTAGNGRAIGRLAVALEVTSLAWSSDFKLYVGDAGGSVSEFQFVQAATPARPATRQSKRPATSRRAGPTSRGTRPSRPAKHRLV